MNGATHQPSPSHMMVCHLKMHSSALISLISATIIKNRCNWAGMSALLLCAGAGATRGALPNIHSRTSQQVYRLLGIRKYRYVSKAPQAALKEVLLQVSQCNDRSSAPGKNYLWPSQCKSFILVLALKTQLGHCDPHTHTITPSLLPIA